MTSHNPYEDYDAIDPYEDDEQDTGNFAFVEDEYDGMRDPGLAERQAPPHPSAQEDQSAQDFPRTMVRPVVHVSDTALHEAQTPQHPSKKLRRHHKERSASAQRQQVPQPVVKPVARGYYPDAVPQRSVRSERPRRRGHHHFGCLFRLAILIGIVCGAYWVLAHPIDERLAFAPSEQQTLTGKLSLYVPTTPAYILALGSDAREGESYSRTDTMVLVRVDMWSGTITLLSIPRDTMVEIDGQGTQKINAAYAFGGAGGAVQAVSELTGERINHVAVVHFEELAGIVDYLGGVTLNVPTPVYDPNFTGLNLDAGMQTLDGNTALLSARSRYGYESGDYQRQENQRILITAIMNRILSLSPSMIPGLINDGDLIGTDLRCYNLIPLFIRFKLSNPTVYSAAVPTTSDWVDGISYEVANTVALQNLMRVIDEGGDPALAM